jgi:hypothetical protein
LYRFIVHVVAARMVVFIADRVPPFVATPVCLGHINAPEDFGHSQCVFRDQPHASHLAILDEDLEATTTTSHHEAPRIGTGRVPFQKQRRPLPGISSSPP